MQSVFAAARTQAPIAGGVRAPFLTYMLVFIGLGIAGCSSLLSEGAATGAGVAGTAVAASVTNNAAVASGIGFGVIAPAPAGVKTIERNYHGNRQDEIAEIAGGLTMGQVAPWRSAHTIELEPDEAGRVTVSRIISATDLSCREIVFSVDQRRGIEAPASFFVATICKDALKW